MNMRYCKMNFFGLLLLAALVGLGIGVVVVVIMALI